MSVEGIAEKDVAATMHKIVAWLSGETNQRINDWVNNDEESYKNIIKFMDICASNGWNNLKESPFEYATDEAQQIASDLYKKAMQRFGSGK